MTSTATSSPISPGRLNPFHSGQNHFYSHHGSHHLYSPIINKRRFNSPIRVDELDFLSSTSYIEESDSVLLDILRSSNNHHLVSTSPAKSCIYMTNVNIPHPTNPCPVTTITAAAATTGENCSPESLNITTGSGTTIPLSPIDEEEVEVEFINHTEIQRSHPLATPSAPAKYDATLPKKSPTRSLLSSFTPSVEIVVEDTSQMI